MTWGLILAAALSVSAQDAPYYPRGTQSNQDIGGINQNFAEQSLAGNPCLTTTISPTTCPAGQALTGACYFKGRTWGGSCTAIPAANSGSSISGSTGPLVFLASGTFTNVNIVDISTQDASWNGLTTFSSHTCELTVSFITASAGNAAPYASFNEDTGTNYGSSLFQSNGGFNLTDYTVGTAHCIPFGEDNAGAYQLVAGTMVRWVLRWGQGTTKTNLVGMTDALMDPTNSAPLYARSTGAWNYNGSATISNVQWFQSTAAASSSPTQNVKMNQGHWSLSCGYLEQ